MSYRLATLLLFFAVTITHAEDWAQWLGPNRDGVSSTKVAPWKGELKTLWSKPVGEGNSSPVVADGLVYIHAKVKGKDVETVQAFDAKSGDLKWEQSYEKTPFKPFYGEGPRATPTVSKGKVFTFGNTGVLACWDAKTGKPDWKIDVLENPKVDNLFFGLSASPLVVGEAVIVQGGGKGTKGLRAFNRETGKALWTAGDDAASYAAPIFTKNEIVALTGANLVGISAKGEMRWKYPFKDSLNESSTTPIQVGDLYICSSVKAGAAGVRIVEESDKATVKEVWKNEKLTCYFSTPISVDKDHLYMVTGVASLTGATITLRCVETATGKEVWNKPKIGKFHAALLKLSDGKLLMHDDTGNLTLLAPNVKEYEELAKAKVCGSTWAHPALSNGVIFVRDDKEIRALKLGE